MVKFYFMSSVWQVRSLMSFVSISSLLIFMVWVMCLSNKSRLSRLTLWLCLAYFSLLLTSCGWQLEQPQRCNGVGTHFGILQGSNWADYLKGWSQKRSKHVSMHLQAAIMETVVCEQFYEVFLTIGIVVPHLFDVKINMHFHLFFVIHFVITGWVSTVVL